MSRFLPTSAFKLINHKELNLNKYTSNSSKRYVLQVDLEYPKELCKLDYDYFSARDKIKIKNECCLSIN